MNPKPPEDTPATSSDSDYSEDAFKNHEAELLELFAQTTPKPRVASKESSQRIQQILAQAEARLKQS